VLSGAPAPAATSTAPENAQPDNTELAWLERVNYFRTIAAVDPIAANASMSEADAKHARYMVKNYTAGQSHGIEMHSESQHNQWYSAEGYTAARTSDVIPPGGLELTDKQAIDLWIQGPFHRLPILNPNLKEAGFGSFDEDGLSAIAMQLRKPSALEDPNAPSPSHRSFIRSDDSSDTGGESESNSDVQRVVEFPPANSVFPLAAFTLRSGQIRSSRARDT
jgi:Cysteine-rich secretory protein family